MGPKLGACQTPWVIFKMFPAILIQEVRKGLRNVCFSKHILDNSGGDAFQTTLGETLNLNFCDRSHWLPPKVMFPLLFTNLLMFK